MALKSSSGKNSSGDLVSCRHSTSILCFCSSRFTIGKRSRTELMFQVAMRIYSPRKRGSIPPPSELFENELPPSRKLKRKLHSRRQLHAAHQLRGFFLYMR